MGRLLKVHLRPDLDEKVPQWSRARCGRWLNRHRLISSRSLGRWGACVRLKTACRDCARLGPPAKIVKEVIG